MTNKDLYAQRACPVCNNSIVHCLYTIEISSSDTILPNGYNIVSCERCGMCYADTSASQADYDRYYSECNNYSGVQSVREEYNALHNLIGEKLEALISRDASIIDIGFGKGELLCFLKSKGYEHLYGLDPSGESVAAIQKEGIKAFVGSIYDDLDDSISYDVVFLGGVIEHLLFPDEAIKRINRLLKPTGLLIIAYPDFSDMSEDNYDIASNFNQEHINYFSEMTIDHLCAKNSLKRIAGDRWVSFTTTGSTQYGMIGFYRKDQSYNPIITEFYDDKTNHAITEYIKRISTKEEKTKDIISELAKNGEPVSVWGTGQYTLRLMATSALSECNIEFFIDSNPLKIGKDFQGKKIQPPDSLYDYDGTVLVCSMMYSEEIVARAKEINPTIKTISL